MKSSRVSRTAPPLAYRSIVNFAHLLHRVVKMNGGLGCEPRELWYRQHHLPTSLLEPSAAACVTQPSSKAALARKTENACMHRCLAVSAFQGPRLPMRRCVKHVRCRDASVCCASGQMERVCVTMAIFASGSGAGQAGLSLFPSPASPRGQAPLCCYAAACECSCGETVGLIGVA